MTKWQSCMRSEDGQRAIKYKGIHEPSGRVKGYRVEIRPSNSPKIWVGTFDTRHKAMRAFDAAVYLTGKEPYYFMYPENYFPARPTDGRRETVQTEAKKFAERTDALKFNPSSFLVDTSKAAAPVERISPDVKPVKASDQTFVSLDESLKKAKYLPVFAEQIPALDANTCWDSPSFEESKLPVAVAKSAVEEVKFGEEVKVHVKELAAFDKGYHNPNSAFITDLLHQDLPGDIFPLIEGEPSVPFLTFAENLSYSSNLSSKRKREGDAVVLPTVEVADTDVSAWFASFDSDPVNQAPTNIDWLEITLPPSWPISDLISSNPF